MLEDTVNAQLAILLGARALLNNADAVKQGLSKLDLTLLPANIASAAAFYSDRAPALGGNASGPPPASVGETINAALDYYASVHKLLQGAFVPPEISEDAAVAAINKYWQKTTLAIA